MMEPESLLDTDTLSALLRPNANAVARAQAYTLAHGQLSISIITQFEVLRGLKARDSGSRLRMFARFVSTHRVLPLTEEIVETASGIYADLYKRGELISDADILIAATAIQHGMVLVTNNERHFSRIPNLTIENWLK